MINHQPKRLFADIETSPNLVLSFGVGYNLNINPDAIVKERKVICAAWKWSDEKKVTVIPWDKNQDDRAILEEFVEVAAEADEVVGHYLNHFDLPWIRARCLIHGLPPIPLYKTIDTKALASKYFYFNSNKLDYLSKVLGHGGKEKMEFDDWKQITLYNDKKALKKMCHYCGVDVLKLEKVFNDIYPYVQAKTHAGVFAHKDKWSCAHCGSEDVATSKRRVSAGGSVSFQMKCNACGSFHTVNQKTYTDYIEAKTKTK